MNANVVGTVVVDLDRKGVVQILSGVRVDGEDTFATQVLANLELPFRDTAMTDKLENHSRQ